MCNKPEGRVPEIELKFFVNKNRFHFQTNIFWGVRESVKLELLH